MVDNPLSFEKVNQAIEQQALGKKMAGLEQTRQDTEDWAVRDAINKGIPIDDIVALSSPDFARPTAAQYRSARDLEVDVETGDLHTNMSRNLRHDLEDYAESFMIGVDIPEIRPVFVGLRRVINRWRLGRAEKKVETLVSSKAKAAHIGTVVLRNKFSEGYYTYADDGVLEVPGKHDSGTIDSLEGRQTKRHRRISRVSGIDMLVKDSHGMRVGRRTRAKARNTRKSAELDGEIRSRAYESPEITDKLRKSVHRRSKLRAKQDALEAL